MSSARALYAEPKAQLCQRVGHTVATFGAVAGGIGKGGKAEEILRASRDNFVATERLIHESAENLRKLELLHIHMNFQFENIEKNVALIENLKEQAQSMRR